MIYLSLVWSLLYCIVITCYRHNHHTLRLVIGIRKMSTDFHPPNRLRYRHMKRAISCLLNHDVITGADVD